MADNRTHTGINWKLLTRFAEGKADAGEKRIITEWIGAAPEERRPVVDELIALYRDRTEADRQLSEAIFRRFCERYQIPHEPEEALIQLRPSIQPNRTWRTVLRAAAGIAVLVAALSLLFNNWNRRQSASGNTETAVQWKELKVKPGKQTYLTLADGSEIRISPGSTIKYPAQFTGRNREVYLDGAAFFQIARDTGKPFIVHTAQLTTRVLGTSFLVEAFKENPHASVTVVTGKVAVSKADDDPAIRAEATLEPNQQAIVDEARDSVRVMTVPANVAWAIRDGKLVFESRSIRDIATVLEYRYGVVVHLEDEKAATMELTAIMDGNIPLDDMLHILGTVTNLRIRQSGTDVYIGGQNKK